MGAVNFLYKVKDGPLPEADPGIHASVYVNYWKLPTRRHCVKGKEYLRWLDIGVIVYGFRENIEEIAICLPFKIKTEDVEDLSPCLKDEKLASQFLGRSCSYHSMANSPGYHHLKYEDPPGGSLYVYQISTQNKYISGLEGGGSVLHVKVISNPTLPKEIKESPGEGPQAQEVDAAKADEVQSESTRKYDLYFQFRIRISVDTGLIHNEDISNALVQSAFSKSEMVDIVFNDVANMHPTDRQCLNNEHTLLNLSDVYFSFIGSSEDETVVGNRPFDDCEVLDREIWKAYMPEIDSSVRQEKEERRCVRYQWKASDSRKKVFFKTVYSSRHWKKILIYSLYVVLLSFMASCCLEGCKSFCKWGNEKFQEHTREKKSTTDTSSSSTTVVKPSLMLQ